jgi:hypothetical protein
MTSAPLLRDLLLGRSIDPKGTFALRVALDPRDRSSDFTCSADLIKEQVVATYERMQNGLRFGREGNVISFIAEADGCARLVGYRRFVARRKGIVPGSIVYDYDAAHLLHSFMARAKHPVFYDSFDLDGLDDLIGKLVVYWPKPMMQAVRRADHESLVLASVQLE